MEKIYLAGIDVGSTTVKLVILDSRQNLVFGKYRRHHAHTLDVVAQLLQEAKESLGDCELRIKTTGSGAINLGMALCIGFGLEVGGVATDLLPVAAQ